MIKRMVEAMAYNGIAKVQHYVPQFLLRNFGNGKKNQLYVFDKQKARSFASNTRNIACESRFYDFQVDGEEFSIEPALSKIEGQQNHCCSGLLMKIALQYSQMMSKRNLPYFFRFNILVLDGSARTGECYLKY